MEKLTAEEQIDRAFSVLGDGWFTDPVMKQMHKECADAISQVRSEEREKQKEVAVKFAKYYKDYLKQNPNTVVYPAQLFDEWKNKATK